MTFKKRDEWARPVGEYDLIMALPDSVVTKPLGRLEDRSSPGKTKPRTPPSAQQAVDAVAALPPSSLEIPSVEALIGAAQLNVIEFHTWNSRPKHVDKADRMIFNLDPGEGVDWPQIQEAALLTRALLTELELESWLKTSGGKVFSLLCRWRTCRLRHDHRILKGDGPASGEDHAFALRG